MDNKSDQGRQPATVAEQEDNAIRFIGDRTQDGSTVRELPDEHFHETIGAANYKSGLGVLKRLREDGQIMVEFESSYTVPKSGGGHLYRPTLRGVGLTRKGRREYDQISAARDETGDTPKGPIGFRS